MVKAFDTPITTNDQSIDRVLATQMPVVFVFLDGSGTPQLDDAMKRIARDHSGKLLVVRIQVKDNPASTRRYQVNHTPAVVTVNKGQVLSRAENISVTELEKHVDYLLGRGPKPEVTPRTNQSPGSRPAAATQPGPGQARATNAGPVTVTDTTFDREVMNSSQPVLVDFWAPWCGPCRITSPMVDKLAHELPGRLKVAKVNVDENPATSQRFGIQSIPTMLVVKNGQIVDRWVGALPEAPLRNRIQQIL